MDINNNIPQFVFPESNDTVFEVPENSPVGSPLIYNGTNLQLTFKATDKDEGENGQIIYTWSSKFILLLFGEICYFLKFIYFLDNSVNDVFSLNSDTGVVTLNSALNRSIQSYYNVRFYNCWNCF